jgi:hypothetical protein
MASLLDPYQTRKIESSKSAFELKMRDRSKESLTLCGKRTPFSHGKVIISAGVKSSAGKLKEQLEEKSYTHMTELLDTVVKRSLARQKSILLVMKLVAESARIKKRRKSPCERRAAKIEKWKKRLLAIIYSCLTYAQLRNRKIHGHLAAITLIRKDSMRSFKYRKPFMPGPSKLQSVITMDNIE